MDKTSNLILGKYTWKPFGFADSWQNEPFGFFESHVLVIVL
jgi:hypothetical protein